MTRDKAYLVGVHRYSHKTGVPAEIVGVEMVKPSDDLEPRLCYHVRWFDMCEDWIAIDGGHFKIISFTDILNGNIPEVTD
jgi:hypothetical protein